MILLIPNYCKLNKSVHFSDLDDNTTLCLFSKFSRVPHRVRAHIGSNIVENKCENTKIHVILCHRPGSLFLFIRRRPKALQYFINYVPINR